MFDRQKQPLEVFCRKDVLGNFAKFTGKHLCQSLFFNKVACLKPVTLLKKRLWHRCFPVNFEKFLRTPFLWNTSGRLLLDRVLNTPLFYITYIIESNTEQVTQKCFGSNYCEKILKNSGKTSTKAFTSRTTCQRLLLS